MTQMRHTKCANTIEQRRIARSETRDPSMARCHAVWRNHGSAPVNKVLRRERGANGDRKNAARLWRGCLLVGDGGVLGGENNCGRLEQHTGTTQAQ